MKTEQPKIKINLSLFDWFLECASLFILIMLWLYVCVHYAGLPEIIPTHYNLVGQADAFGVKQTIFLLPVLGVSLFVGLGVLSKYPHIFNYLVPITKENALRQYTISARLIRILKCVILLIFTLVLYKIIQDTVG